MSVEIRNIILLVHTPNRLLELMRRQFDRCGQCYVSVKTCSDRRASLDLVPPDANLQLTSIVYVTREQTIIHLAGSVQSRTSVPGLFHSRDVLLDH